MRKDHFVNLLAILALLWAVLSCKMLNSTSSNEGSNTNEHNANANIATNAASPSETKTETADFTMTAEDLDKEFHGKSATREALEAKYAFKTIALTGRITLLQTVKKGTIGPWVMLYVQGSPLGPVCEFDDNNANQASGLKRDQLVKVQGFQNSFVVPGVSPRLKQCVVLEVK